MAHGKNVSLQHIQNAFLKKIGPFDFHSKKRLIQNLSVSFSPLKASAIYVLKRVKGVRTSLVKKAIFSFKFYQTLRTKHHVQETFPGVQIWLKGTLMEI